MRPRPPFARQWNRKAVEITGFSRSEVLGEHLVNKYIRDEFRASVQAVLDSALRGQSTDNFTFPLFKRTGERVEVLLNATTRRNASGEIVGVVGVGQDITEISKSQAELSRVANDFSMLIETANAPIFGIDASGMVNEWVRVAGFELARPRIARALSRQSPELSRRSRV